ncbi:MAG: ATP-binding cassette domain-containing protein [Deltaproteobacteria bacterium]|jgi:ABC-2 type transport system ATP-binding protein
MPPPENKEEVALTAESVSKSFHPGSRLVQALDKVSFSVGHSKVTGLVGPDGGGKTTLLRLAAGLLLPDSGQLYVLGIDVIHQALLVQRSIGYMPQHFGLYEDLTVQENMDLYADLQGVPHGDRASRYVELTRMTGLAPFTQRLAGALSGGMKQKLGLACTLVRAPRFLLLDEPTVGVDPVSRRELWAIVYRLVDKEGMTVLLTTAYLDEAERCQEVILLHQGKVLGHGDPAGLAKDMKSRSYQVTAAGFNKRTLEERLARGPGILDAIIHGDGVRLVTEKAQTPVREEILPDLRDARILPVDPRFEDYFIMVLKQGTGPLPSTLEKVEGKGKPSRTGDVIVVQDVKRRFGDFYAVKGISFTARHGEVFGLLGANGAGKSTTFRMLCGLLPASEGTLMVAGHDLRQAAAGARGRIGYMAQRFSLYANLSVIENLRFFSRVYGLQGARQRGRIAWALEEFGMDSFAEAKSGDLPLGYKQRLALAAALMHEPEILFLDEPTSGVDPLARREFWHRINYFAEGGVTVLVTTHFMEEAEYCDRLVIMAEGEILAEGTPEEMKKRYRSSSKPEPTMEDAFIALIQARRDRKDTA